MASVSGEPDGFALRTRLWACELSCKEVANTFLSSVQRDPYRAWASVDGDWLMAQAAARDRISPAERRALPLFGLLVGVKDNVETSRLPTTYGSGIYAGFRPRADASLVTRLCQAGALIAGKTKLAEFAWMTPPDTLNPLDLTRTPGGSSSGSAVAVASGDVPLAIGTQTAGSINRPASYCGIVGFKPTFGVLPRDGVKLMSSTLDSVGLLTRSVRDMALAMSVCSTSPSPVSPRGFEETAPRLGFARTADWRRVDCDARDAIDETLETIRRFVPVEELELPPTYVELVAAQRTIQFYESARALQGELEAAADQLSPELRGALRTGAAIGRDDYAAARRCADQHAPVIDALLAGYDGVLSPSATGTPPQDLRFTGDPLFSRAWMLIGAPSLSVPLAWTEDQLPVGLQMIAATGRDRRLLAAGAWLMNRWADRLGL